MFCENCGHQVTDGSRFCEHCGAPIAAPAQPQETPAEQTVAVQPQEAPVEQTVAVEQPVYATTEPQPTAYGEQQPYAPAQPQQAPYGEQAYTPVQPQQAPYGQQAYAPVQPAAPKKPMSKKAKLIILFSSIGAAVIAAALIVLFVVIIPMINKANEEANKIDITKYITVSFEGVKDDNKAVYDGNISGSLTWDYDKFIKDQKLKEDTDKYDTALYSIKDYTMVSMEKTSGEKNKKDEGVTFNSAKKDDVFTVKVTWRDDEISKKSLAAQEKQYDTAFNHSEKTKELKLADPLKEQNITVKEPVEADILGYISKNNLIYSEENSGGSYNVYVKEFETTFGDFKFIKNSYYSNSIDITDKNGEAVTYVYLEFDKDSDYCESGEELTLGYEEYYKESAAEDGILLVGDPVKYTVSGGKTEGTTAKAESSKTESSSSKAESSKTSSKASSKAESSAASSKTESSSSDSEVGLSLEDAKKCVEQLKSYLTENVYDEDDKATKGDKIDVKSIYYVHDKDSSYRRIVFVYENTSAKYFRALETDPEDLTLNGSKLETDFVYFSESDPASTLEAATENNWYLSKTYKDFYNITQLQ